MLEPNFIPFPELTTARLLLRKIIHQDAPEILFLRSDKNILEFLGKEPAKTIREAEDFIKSINDSIDAGNVIMWAIALKDDPGQLIGTICLWEIRKEHYRAEAGFVLHPEFWRKGFMKEALRRIIEFGFSTLQLHSIEARISPGNMASAAILESTGFVREAYFKEDFFFRGKFLDTAVYSLLNNSTANN